MSAVWIWAVTAVLFLLAEILTTSLFFLLWALAAAGVAVLTRLAAPAWTWQLFWFGVFSVPLLGLWTLFGRHRRQHRDAATLLNRRGMQYIGREFVLTAPVQQGIGRLQIGDTLWQLKGQDLPAGAKIVITDAQDNSLSYRHAD